MDNDKLNKVLTALNKMKAAADKVWFADGGVVEAVNELVDALEEAKESYDPPLPSEIRTAIDWGALQTAWIYERIAKKGDKGKDKGNMVRRALGYNVDGWLGKRSGKQRK